VHDTFCEFLCFLFSELVINCKFQFSLNFVKHLYIFRVQSTYVVDGCDELVEYVVVALARSMLHNPTLLQQKVERFASLDHPQLVVFQTHELPKPVKWRCNK
jgi:hypothetical protein